MKWLGVFLIPLDRMLVHGSSFLTKLLGFPNNLPVPIYTPGWREALCELSVLPKNTTQCPWPGLKPGPLTPRTSTLTMRPPCLPLQERGDENVPILEPFDIYLTRYLPQWRPPIQKRTGVLVASLRG